MHEIILAFGNFVQHLYEHSARAARRDTLQHQGCERWVSLHVSFHRVRQNLRASMSKLGKWSKLPCSLRMTKWNSMNGFAAAKDWKRTTKSLEEYKRVAGTSNVKSQRVGWRKYCPQFARFFWWTGGSFVSKLFNPSQIPQTLASALDTAHLRLGRAFVQCTQMFWVWAQSLSEVRKWKRSREPSQELSIPDRRFCEPAKKYFKKIIFHTHSAGAHLSSIFELLLVAPFLYTDQRSSGLHSATQALSSQGVPDHWPPRSLLLAFHWKVIRIFHEGKHSISQSRNSFRLQSRHHFVPSSGSIFLAYCDINAAWRCASEPNQRLASHISI